MLKTGNLGDLSSTSAGTVPIYTSRGLSSSTKRKPSNMPMDGNAAAAHVGYGLSDLALIFPITPSSPMGEKADELAAGGTKNAFGRELLVQQMQSEAGVAGAIHGSLAAGSLTTTFTASQGLLLMIPNMYKIAGEVMPTVFHVTARAVAGQALSIFGDNTDVMATRQTGFSLLSSSSVQEAMDLGLVSHLASLKSSLPFVHFFDGFRTSHEIQKIDVINYDEMRDLVDMDAIQKFRMKQLNPTWPHIRGTAQGPDLYFQFVETANNLYRDVPDHVRSCMKQVGDLTGRKYDLFDYVGHPKPETVVVMLAAGIPVAEELIEHLVKEKGQRVGLVKVRLYRPFDGAALAKAIPKSAKNIVVLERTKEPGSLGEPLYLDVIGALHENGRSGLKVIGGRYGLGGKDFTPMMAKAAIENGQLRKPKNHFTLGIIDDVSNTSLEVPGFTRPAKKNEEVIDTVGKGTKQCVFWGLGSDGTVGANKSAIKIISNNTPLHTQGYFSYDAHKTGGVTVSHLRFGKSPIKSQYLIQDGSADYVACHNPAFLKKFDVVGALKKKGTFVFNSPWDSDSEIEANLPGALKRRLAESDASVYLINASRLAGELGMKGRINMIMQTVFFKLAVADLLPIEEAARMLKDEIKKTYGSKGEKVVKKNEAAVDSALGSLRKLEYDRKKWLSELDAVDDKNSMKDYPPFVRDVMMPAIRMKGDYVPVSKFPLGGAVPLGTTKYEKRGIAEKIPIWDSKKCVQCNQCSFVCPHAAIRPFLLDDKEKEQFLAVDKDNAVKKATGVKEPLHYRIQVSNLDCTGCNLCAQACPTNCLSMEPSTSDRAMKEIKNWDVLSSNVKQKPSDVLPDRFQVKGSQFQQPLVEFSGACGGCGQTPLGKLVTQLFGDRMVIANATGCSSIWGAYAPAQSYTVNDKGHGPAWANSLFEDNAEFGAGIAMGHFNQRMGLRSDVEALAKATDNDLRGVDAKISGDIRAASKEWLSSFNHGDKSKAAGERLLHYLEIVKKKNGNLPEKMNAVYDTRHHLTKISHWIFGGDGWAYDIGYGGLDHVLHMPLDVNVLVFDTEAYSNTGGQRSKATPRGGTAKFAISGKKERKKDLGMIAMQIGGVYVASICTQADPKQAIKALKEAEEFDGPSLILAYAPCIQHGIDGGLGNGLEQSKKAVDTGYWMLYRYDPRSEKLTIDSKPPKKPVVDFLRTENRFQQLERTFPEEADRLHKILQDDINERSAKYETFATNANGKNKSPKPASPSARASLSGVVRSLSDMSRERDLQSHPVLEVPTGQMKATFSWNGHDYEGKEGEMLSTALIANGVDVFGTHPRDNSPQGLYCANGMCSQCLVMANGVPVKSCMTPLTDGMKVLPANLPELPKDDYAGTEAVPIGARLEKAAVEDVSECDVLVIGGGPSGMCAALELGEKGADVVLIDDKNVLGGKLVVQTHKFFGSKDESAGVRGFEIGESMSRKIKALDNVRVQMDTAALGVFSDGKIGLYNTRENFYSTVKPKKILVATGAREKFLSFPGNTLPGVYGAGAFQTLLNRDLVKPGNRVLIVGGGNVGLITGYHAIQAGVEVAALVEALPRCGGYKVHADKLARLGVPIYTRHSVKEAKPNADGTLVEEVVIVEIDEKFKEIPGTEKSFKVDTLLLAVGLSPANEFTEKARKFGYKVFSAGDADEIAEASSAMFGGKIAGKIIANELGLSNEVIKEEWKEWSGILKAKPGRVREGEEIEVLNDLTKLEGMAARPILHCHEEIPCDFCTTCPMGVIEKEEGLISALPYITDGTECFSCLECISGCPGLAITLVGVTEEDGLKYVFVPFELEPHLGEEGKMMHLTDLEGADLGDYPVEEVIERENKTRILKFKVPDRIANKIAGFRIQEKQKESVPTKTKTAKSEEKFVCRCERVTESEIRKVIADGYTDLNQIKVITRAGMGACGGKTCTDMVKRIMTQMGVDKKTVKKAKARPLFMETPLSAFL